MHGPNRLLEDLRSARERLDSAIAALDDADFGDAVAPGNWTIRDVLNHVAAWDRVGATTIRDLTAGRPPSRYVDDVDGFNADAVESARRRSAAECRAALGAARAEFEAALGALPPDAWRRETLAGGAGESVSITRVCQTWARHDHEHAAELEKFAGGRSADFAG